MRGDDEDATVVEHLVDDADMAVDVIGEDARPDRVPADGDRIEIVVEPAAARTRMGAEHRG